MPQLEMLAVSEALERILDYFQRLPSETVPIDSALGRVLAEDVSAPHDVPPFANSAMDGYALRAGDSTQASTENSITLKVIEDIPAGITPHKTVEPGTASRIMTGAPLPSGADAIIPVEDTSENWRAAGRDQLPLPETVEIFKSVETGQYVRPAGQDVAAGVVALRNGTLLRPQEIGVLAALGVGRVAGVQRPLVGVLSTGDELLAVDDPIQPGKIRDVNGYTLRHLVTVYGGEAHWMGIATDQATDVRQRISTALENGVNTIISSAGVSVGAFDVVREVLNEFGQVDFWRVRMRPGKPLAFGLVNDVPFFGLPGNPVSAMVSFDIFVRPALLKLGGRDWRIETMPVVLADTFNSDGRESYLRVDVRHEDGQLVAHTTGGQGSNLLTSMVRANALLILPEGVTLAQPGETYQARLFD